MNIDLIFPSLPPALDGIGDYTARFAEELGKKERVRVLTAQSHPAPIEGVQIEQGFSIDRRRGILEAIDTLRSRPPDWCVLQFNQFSYGRWGLNPYVPLLLREIRRELPGTRIAVMFHEDFVPASHWKNVMMTTWQRAQFFALGRLAHMVLFSIEHWVERYSSWFAGVPVYHLPVGSNIPMTGVSRTDARRKAGVEEYELVIGVFGTLHVSRLRNLIQAGVEAARADSNKICQLYVGPDGEELRSIVTDVPIIDAGKLSASSVSHHLSAMDLHLVPFMDGLSTRRGSFMAGIQHGVASVGTYGPQTDSILKEHNRKSFILTAPDDEVAFATAVRKLAHDKVYRQEIGTRGAKLYEQQFDWPVLARTLLDMLRKNEEKNTLKIH